MMRACRENGVGLSPANPTCRACSNVFSLFVLGRFHVKDLCEYFPQDDESRPLQNKRKSKVADFRRRSKPKTGESEKVSFWPPPGHRDVTWFRYHPPRHYTSTADGEYNSSCPIGIHSVCNNAPRTHFQRHITHPNTPHLLSS